jgi:sugar phosphate isomerase/epimerase
MLKTFSTLGCPDATLDEAIALARQRGLTALELRALEDTLDLPAYFQRTLGSPAALAAKLEAAGVRIAALDTGFRVMAASEADRAALLAFLPWAEALGGVRLRVFDAGTTLTDEELAAGVAEMRWWYEQRRVAGWRSDLMIETHDSLVTTPTITRFLAAAPKGTAILWDSHHTWKKGGEDPVQTWRALRPAVVHIHVKDSISAPSERHPFTYVLPGDGEFPMRPLVEALRADGFSGPLSLEWERKWHPYLAPVADALAAAEAKRWW